MSKKNRYTNCGITHPKKPFAEYTDEEWEKTRNMKSCGELKKIMTRFKTLESFKMSNITLTAIETYKK